MELSTSINIHTPLHYKSRVSPLQVSVRNLQDSNSTFTSDLKINSRSHHANLLAVNTAIYTEGKENSARTRSIQRSLLWSWLWPRTLICYDHDIWPRTFIEGPCTSFITGVGLVVKTKAHAHWVTLLKWFRQRFNTEVCYYPDIRPENVVQGRCTLLK